RLLQRLKLIAMKSCSYCGRENRDDADHCHECGTALAEPTAAAQLSDESAGLDWFVFLLRYAGTALLVVGLYLLSFGPVRRYCGTVISQTYIPASTNYTTTGSGYSTVIRSSSMMRTIRYPRWISIVYYPAFWMSSWG